MNRAVDSATDANGGTDQLLKHRVQIERRAPDDPQHFGRCPLAPQRLGEFALRFRERRRPRLADCFFSPRGAGARLLVQGACLWPNACCRNSIDPGPSIVASPYGDCKEVDRRALGSKRIEPLGWLALPGAPRDFERLGAAARYPRNRAVGPVN